MSLVHSALQPASLQVKACHCPPILVPSLLAFCCTEPGVLSTYARLAAVCDPAAATRLGSELGAAGAGLPAAELDSLENANIGERIGWGQLSEWGGFTRGGLLLASWTDPSKCRLHLGWCGEHLDLFFCLGKKTSPAHLHALLAG